MSFESSSGLRAEVSMVKVGPRKGYSQECIAVSEGQMRVPSESGKDYNKRLLWSSVYEHTGPLLGVQQRQDVPASRRIADNRFRVVRFTARRQNPHPYRSFRIARLIFHKS